MENDLIMNQLPLPKYYDGESWNTVLRPTRKSIPKYLHEDLPELRHLYIKEIFKEMGKFNCPNLDYFNKMIKKKNAKEETGLKGIAKRRDSRLSNRNSDNLSGRGQKPTYEQVKEELQYALLIADRDSNLVDNLVEKAQKVEQSSLTLKKKRKSSPGRVYMSASKSKAKSGYHIPSVPKVKKNVKCFDNTVDLVFRNRRNLYLQNLKKEKETDEVPQNFEKQFEEMRLLDFNQPSF